jgi:hypothetical protein
MACDCDGDDPIAAPAHLLPVRHSADKGARAAHHRCCPAELRLRAACAVCSLQAGKAQEDRTEQDSSVRTEYTHHRTTCSLSLSLLRQEGGPREKMGLARRPS